MLQLLGGMIKAEEPQNLPTLEKIGQLSITICYFLRSPSVEPNINTGCSEF